MFSALRRSPGAEIRDGLGFKRLAPCNFRHVVVNILRFFGELMDTFEIGDKVVYPNHGVGIIEKISNRLVAGKFERFYLLRICSNDILVMVPTANAGDVGLRKIIERRDVDHLLSL